MSGWEVGDRALCVDAAPRLGQPLECHLALAQISEGSLYTVVGIGASGGLLIAEAVAAFQANGGGWLRERFRKIKPDAHERCEDEFVTLLERSKRPVKA